MQQATSILMDKNSYTTADVSVRLQSGALGAVYGFIFCFLAATVVAVWAAYDGAGALNRFFWLLGGISAVLAAPLLGRYFSLRSTVKMITGLTILMVTVTTVLYLIQRISAVVSDVTFPTWWPLILSDNQAAQILAVGIPILVAALWLALVERRWMGGTLSGAALLLGVVALVLTESRGALLGLAAAASVAFYFWVRSVVQRNTHRKSGWLWLVDASALLIAVGAVIFYVVIVAFPEFDIQLGVSAQGGSALSRIALWRDSVPLIADYYFTGSGLGSAVMVYATYTYLLHVPYLYHAHNFYLQVALEQGVPALLAWIGLVIATVVYAAGALRIANHAGHALLVGGYAALATFLVHSLFESELYFGVLGGLVFYAPVVLLWSADAIYEPALDDPYADRPSRAVGGVGFMAGLLAPVFLATLVPGALPRWEANLGAVTQTRVELSVYERPQWAFQDQVRRQLHEELKPAEAHFLAALQLDPAQPTAHRRLGAIALARGEFGRARNHLITAYAVAPYDRATRQMLGEVLALDGNLEEALVVWRGLDMSQGQFMVREWWYQALGQPEQVEKLSNAVQAFKRSE